jgi:Raf kinase inhibitor-like YbhB/YbcL family protein
MWWRVGSVAVMLALLAAPASASTFTLDTSAFLNGGPIPATDASDGDHCGGRNVSPPLFFLDFPANTRSFAVVTFDIDAGGGRGYVHWVAYGIAPTMRTLPPGFGSQPSPAYTGGTNDPGTLTYFGPCPPPGDKPHHYVFTAYALDLAPGALPPGLTRAAFLRAVAKHILAQAEITGLYARPIVKENG